MLRTRDRGCILLPTSTGFRASIPQRSSSDKNLLSTVTKTSPQRPLPVAVAEALKGLSTRYPLLDHQSAVPVPYLILRTCYTATTTDSSLDVLRTDPLHHSTITLTEPNRSRRVPADPLKLRSLVELPEDLQFAVSLTCSLDVGSHSKKLESGGSFLRYWGTGGVSVLRRSSLIWFFRTFSSLLA